MNTTISSRPHKQSHYRVLENMAITNWHDARVLLDVNHELDYRSTDWAIELNAKIAQQLARLELDRFRFPHTRVRGPSRGDLTINDWEQTGLLRAVGYLTGRYGKDEKNRRRILCEVYTRRIPSGTQIENINEWGTPETSQRLKKLVNSLAAFTRQEKRNMRGAYSVSISEREDDLAFLKRKYYDNSAYDWTYPKT